LSFVAVAGGATDAELIALDVQDTDDVVFFKITFDAGNTDEEEA